MPPIVIAHRGASGHRPEHTLAAYELGARQGADYIEPDLVSTRDGHLVARHENEISGTTDVADRPEFADRRATKTIDGVANGWFAEDFTLAEIKTLRVRERIPQLRPGNAEHDGRYEIPTFQEIIDLAARLGVGIYPETKHPTYHRVDRPAARARARRRPAPQRPRPRAGEGVRAVLRGREPPDAARRAQSPARAAARPARRATPEGLRTIAEYADAVGPNKVHIVPRDAADASLPATPFVADAHAAGLLVHPYTFRRENSFLPAELRRGEDPAAPGDLAAELRQFFALGVDGVFADFPDVAVGAR